MGDPVGCGYGSETEIVVSTLVRTGARNAMPRRPNWYGAMPASCSPKDYSQQKEDDDDATFTTKGRPRSYHFPQLYLRRHPRALVAPQILPLNFCGPFTLLSLTLTKGFGHAASSSALNCNCNLAWTGPLQPWRSPRASSPRCNSTRLQLSRRRSVLGRHPLALVFSPLAGRVP
jgi:hypothetical protein